MDSDSITLPFWIFLGIIEVAVIFFISSIVLFVALRHKSSLLNKKVQVASNKVAARDSLLADYAKRIENLEKFKELYFEIKAKYGVISDLHDKLETQAQEILSPEDYEKLKATLEEIKAEKNILEIKLREAEHELDQIVSKQGIELPKDTDNETAFASAERLNKGISSVRSVIDDQSSVIETLKQQLQALELEVQDKQQLDETINKLQEQNNDLTSALEVLQDENQFLQDQIQALLLDSRESGEKSDHDVSELKALLEQKEQEYVALHKKFSDMEKEYLQIYEEHKKLTK